MKSQRDDRGRVGVGRWILRVLIAGTLTLCAQREALQAAEPGASSMPAGKNGPEDTNLRAPTIGQVDATSAGIAVYDDWKRLCETPPGATERVCFIFQKVNFAETGVMLLQAVIGYFRSDVADPVLILTAPLGTFLPPGIELRVPGHPPIHDNFEVCIAIGCQATMRLDAATLAVFSGDSEAEIIVKDGAKKQVSIPLSLKGLAKGLASVKPKGGR